MPYKRRFWELFCEGIRDVIHARYMLYNQPIAQYYIVPYKYLLDLNMLGFAMRFPCLS